MSNPRDGIGTRIIVAGVHILFWIVIIVPVFWYGIPFVMDLLDMEGK